MPRVLSPADHLLQSSRVNSALPIRPQRGYAFLASAGTARSQPRLAAPADWMLPGQPGAVSQQFGGAVITRNRDHGPDPAAGQGKPLPRLTFSGVVGHGLHDSIFPASGRGPRLTGRCGGNLFSYQSCHSRIPAAAAAHRGQVFLTLRLVIV